MLLRVLLLVAVCAGQFESGPHDALSKMLSLRDHFSCDSCWSDDNPTQPGLGSTDWRLCCFYDCKGSRRNCMRDRGFCQNPASCASTQMCTQWGGIPPEGAVQGEPATWFDDEGNLKTSEGSRAAAAAPDVV